MHAFSTIAAASALLLSVIPSAAGHASIWHPSMWGFNVTMQTFPYDNRPVSPLINYTFDEWWFHGHLDHPPHPEDRFEFVAGQTSTMEIACNKGATTWFNSSEGGNIINPQNPNDPCPGSPIAEYHTTGFDDLKGCALAIAYESDVSNIKPEDFAVFSVNQTCVWNRFTEFQVPEKMPPCPPGGCTCAWFWVHSPDSGGEQNYMNGFQCNITGSTSTVPISKPQIPRRCGADPTNLNTTARTFKDTPGNCTYGAKQPFYWFQAEENNMFEGTYAPPFYLDLYNFKDGAQNDIFEDSYNFPLPVPSPNQTVVPQFLNNPLSQLSQSSSSAVVSSSSAQASVTSAPTSTPTSATVTIISTSIVTSIVTVPVSATPAVSLSSQVASVPAATSVRGSASESPSLSSSTQAVVSPSASVIASPSKIGGVGAGVTITLSPAAAASSSSSASVGSIQARAQRRISPLANRNSSCSKRRTPSHVHNYLRRNSKAY